uniref:glycosyltransferase n=1 Tax=Vibrio anguillarum TaxID=55601 RepID=UPI00188A2442
MKKISVISPCFNEEQNVEELYRRVKHEFDKLDGYCYEHISIDNASTDSTVDILKNIALNDKNVKIIVNSRNFG